MTPPADLLVAWIVRQTSLEAIAWFNAKRADLAIDSSPRAFASIFGSVVRRMGKGALALDASDLAAAEKARPRWRPNGLTGDQAARIVLLLDAARTAERFAERVKGLAASADLGVLVAIYKGLPLYPDPDTLVPVATEGLRTVMRTVFEAVAHQNPFPAESFPQSAWNHMVLKTVFLDSVLHPIIGLDDRWNDELAGILVNYAHGRWAAYRPVAPELWREVGAFAYAAAIADLARVLVEGDPLEQKAPALALTASTDPTATEALARRRDLADAVAAGEITWNDVRSQTPQTWKERNMDESSGANSSGFACRSTSSSAARDIACPCCGGALTAEQIASLKVQLAAEPEFSGDLPTGTMFIDPHCHMIARTTDDYAAMEAAGIVAVIEPAFWLGQPRTNVGRYTDCLSHIIGFEGFRAGQFGIRHYCTVGLSSKEANNEALAEAVMDILPSFAGKEGVVAIGEIGYDDQSPLEDKYLRAQIELAKTLICRL